jgi:GT2 family glycosyltransferase
MTPDAPPIVAIVVVNYGSSALLADNLVPLSRAVPGALVVVVDNRTTEDERSRVSALAAGGGWLTVLPDGNKGFGGGMNLGVARARESGARCFLLLNPDATIAADQLSALVERGSGHPLTMLSPRIVRPDGSRWFDGADLYLDDGRIHSRRRREQLAPTRWEPWLSGACLLVSDELWDLVGGFDEEYFLYWEDVDLSHRVLAAGGALEVCDDIVAIHAEGGTQGEGHEREGGAKSGTYYYYNIRNRMLFASRNLEPGDLRRWRRLSLAVAWEVLLQGGRRQFLRSPIALTSGARGVRDGMRIAHRTLRNASAGRP